MTPLLILIALLHTPMTWILAGAVALAALIEKVVYTRRPTAEKEDSN